MVEYFLRLGDQEVHEPVKLDMMPFGDRRGTICSHLKSVLLFECFQTIPWRCTTDSAPLPDLRDPTERVPICVVSSLHPPFSTVVLLFAVPVVDIALLAYSYQRRDVLDLESKINVANLIIKISHLNGRQFLMRVSEENQLYLY